MILIGVNVEDIRRVLYKLEPEKQNKTLQKALKATAEQARARLAEKAQDSYTIKNAGFKKAMRIRATSGSSPEATIYAAGAPIPLKNFKVSKAKNTLRAQVVKQGKLKELERGGIKAFINHIAVAQRKGKERLKINEKYSSSVPAMLGSQKHVYGLVEPYIAGDLQMNLRKFVDQTLGG